MKICQNCARAFPAYIKIDGILRNLCSRRYCFECSPFKNPKERKIRNKNIKSLCKNCGILCKEAANIYCSNICQQKFQSLKKLEASILRPPAIKNFLIGAVGRKCSICFLEKWRDKEIPLVLDHINGNPEDNSLQNVRLICGNCDMQLPTYKNKNKGNGRAYRRKRYAEGLSY